MQSPIVVGINETSITLQWKAPPPDLTGKPNRNITQYAVTVSPQDGGGSQVAFVPAEIDAVCIITDLRLHTTYDIKIDVIIDTEGQGEQTYDIGSPLFALTTKSKYYCKPNTEATNKHKTVFCNILYTLVLLILTLF